jgi:hypothetical protein
MAETRVRIPVAVLDAPRVYGAFRVFGALGESLGASPWLKGQIGSAPRPSTRCTCWLTTRHRRMWGPGNHCQLVALWSPKPQRQVRFLGPPLQENGSTARDMALQSQFRPQRHGTGVLHRSARIPTPRATCVHSTVHWDVAEAVARLRWRAAVWVPRTRSGLAEGDTAQGA